MSSDISDRTGMFPSRIRNRLRRRQKLPIQPVHKLINSFQWRCWYLWSFTHSSCVKPAGLARLPSARETIRVMVVYGRIEKMS
jgi:hypothetical protein